MKVVLLSTDDLDVAMSKGGTYRYEPVSDTYARGCIAAAEDSSTTLDAEVIKLRFEWLLHKFTRIVPQDAALQRGEVGLVLSNEHEFRVLELV